MYKRREDWCVNYPERCMKGHDAENPGTRVGTAKATKWINGWKMRIISSSGKASD
jgi:hypothetical protein